MTYKATENRAPSFPEGVPAELYDRVWATLNHMPLTGDRSLVERVYVEDAEALLELVAEACTELAMAKAERDQVVDNLDELRKILGHHRNSSKDYYSRVEAVRMLLTSAQTSRVSVKAVRDALGPTP